MSSLICSGKLKRLAFVVLLVTVGQVVGQVDDWVGEGPNHQTYRLLAPRGTYLLDFDKIYETSASLDVETAVTLPAGYTFSLIRQGSVDFINAFVLQNTLFFTRTIDHIITTSIICNVITPAGEMKNLVFRIKGGAKEPVVYAIHFIVNDLPPIDEPVIEFDCTDIVNAAVLRREREVRDEVYHSTMVGAVPAFFNAHRGRLKQEFKGATAYINGIIFTQSEAFIYMYSNVRRDECDIIKLLAIRQGRNELIVDFVDIFENLDGTWSYVYKAPLQQPARGKRSKITFMIQIWSQQFNLKTIMS